MSDAQRPPGPPDPPRCPTCGKNYPWMAGVGPDRCECPRPGVCEHGNLRRKCDVCEMRTRAEAAEARARTAERAAADLRWFCKRVISREMSIDAMTSEARRLDDLHLDVGGEVLTRAEAAEADVAALREVLGLAVINIVAVPPDAVVDRCRRCGGRSARYDGTTDEAPPIQHTSACVLAKPHPGQPLLDRVASLEAQVERLKEREAHFARRLQVSDGGQYRADWDSAIEDVCRRAETAEAQVEVMQKALEGHTAGHMMSGGVHHCIDGATEKPCQRGDNCSCCRFIVDASALSPDAPKRLLDRLRLAEAVIEAVRAFTTDPCLPAGYHPREDCQRPNCLCTLQIALAAYDKQGAL